EPGAPAEEDAERSCEDPDERTDQATDRDPTPELLRVAVRGSEPSVRGPLENGGAVDIRLLLQLAECLERVARRRKVHDEHVLLFGHGSLLRARPLRCSEH